MGNNPFVKITIAYITGIFLYKFFPGLIPIDILLYSLTGIFVFLILFKTLTQKPQSLWKPSIIALLLFIAAGYANYAITSEKNSKNKATLKNGFLIAKVSSFPKETGKTTKIIFEVQAIKHKSKWEKAGGKIIVYFKDTLAKELIPGDRILLDLEVQEIKDAGNPEEFSYKNYLAFHFITKQAFVKAGSWTKIGEEFSLFDIGQRFRLKVMSIIDKAPMHTENKEVLKALTLGYKDNIDAKTKDRFSSTGAMHVLAVSGLHVGIIFMILNFLFYPLRQLKKTNLITSAIIILTLWSYAVITGLSPSVTRATLMFTLIQTGIMLKRQTNIYNTIAASAFIILSINPFIINEIGFWLSYLAVLGIISLYPHIYKAIYINKYKNIFLNIVDKIWALISVSLSAQIATLPITLYFFHSFPTYFLATNLIVIPLVPFVMYGGLVMITFSGVKIIFDYSAKFTDLVLNIINSALENIKALPYSKIDGLYIDRLEFVILLVAILFAILYINTKKIKFVYGFLIMLIVFTSYGIYAEQGSKNQKLFVVYNIRGYSAVNFIDGHDNIMISDVYGDKRPINYAAGNFWLKLGLEKEKFIDIEKLNKKFLFSTFWTINNPAFFFYDNYIKFYDVKIALIDKNFTALKTNKKLKINYILIRNNPKLKIKELLKMYDFDLIIIDKSNSKYNSSHWKDYCKKHDIPCHDVRTKGAFVYRF